MPFKIISILSVSLTDCLVFAKLLNMIRKQKNFEEAKKVSEIFDCLSSTIRLLIVCSLIDGEKSVGEIVDITGTTKGNISQHLRILEDNDIITGKKDGNRIFYSIKDKRIKELIKRVKKLFCADIDL